MNILITTIAISFFVNIILAVILIFIEKRNPSATWAWLLVLLVLPTIGFVLYLFFGQNLSKEKMFDVKTEDDQFHKKLVLEKKNLTKNNSVLSDEYVKYYSDIIHMNYVNSSILFSQNNNVKIYTNGIKKFDALLKSIESAKHHIHIVYYIIKPDILGSKIKEALIKKAKEGVEVRLLYDAMGGRELPKHFFDALKSAGAEVLCFFPAVLPHINIRINYRNHRKIAVIDGQIGFIGGFNIGDEYLGKSKKFGFWRDTHLKITGNAVDDLQQRFLLDWKYASKKNLLLEKNFFPEKLNTGNTGIQIVSSGPDSKEQHIKYCYLKMINSAEESIYIQTPYFVPDESIFEALKLAALSGVDVKIMIPNMPDHPFVYWASYSYIGNLLDSGVKCYTYNNGFLHSKTITVDGKISSIGTANMDIRSFKLNFEVNALIFDQIVSTDLKKIFENDLKDCSEITKDFYNNRSLKIKFKESISRLLSPIL